METLENFHVPLPENAYAALREEAAALKRPATIIARKAIAGAATGLGTAEHPR